MAKETISKSKVERQNILNNPFALKNIQKEIDNIEFIEFENKLVVLKQDVIDFFQVSEDTIDRALSEYDDELKKNGYEIVTGKRFVELKNTIDPRKFAGTKTTRVGIFDFRSFLNLAMVLTAGSIAEKLRSRILDIVVATLHESAGKDRRYINQRDESFKLSYVSNKEIRKKFASAIKKYVEGNNYKYPHLTNLMYQNLFGENATEYKNLLKLGERENLRNTLYREMLDVISGYEEGISTMLKEASENKGTKLNMPEAEEVLTKGLNSPFLRAPRETARKLMVSRDKFLRDVIHEALLPYLEALPPEEYEKYLSNESKIVEVKTKKFIDIIDKNKDVFDRLKDK